MNPEVGANSHKKSMTRKEAHLVHALRYLTQGLRAPGARGMNRNQRGAVQDFHHHHRELLHSEGVVGVGVARKRQGNSLTPQLSLRFYVRRKGDNIKDMVSVPRYLFPPQGDRIVTDVVEVGDIRLNAGRLSEMRPAQPGVSVGINFVAGTLGCFVKKKNSSPVYLLSNAHVIARDGVATPGQTPVYQPAKVDQFGTQPFAELEEIVPFKFSSTQFNNTMDAAIARVHNETDCNNHILHVGQVIGVDEPTRETPVQKVGRTTGLTHGVIEDIHFQWQFTYEKDQHGDVGRVGFRDQVLINRINASAPPFSAKGDSGALVLDQNMHAIGLLFAGSSQVSVCNPLPAVLNRLNLELA